MLAFDRVSVPRARVCASTAGFYKSGRHDGLLLIGRLQELLLLWFFLAAAKQRVSTAATELLDSAPCIPRIEWMAVVVGRGASDLEHPIYVSPVCL